jgi:AcrR family transcriptional regulator
MATPVPDLAPLTPAARRVLDAASTLFYNQGIHAVGVDTIAEAAGVSKKTIYDRFGSKETLVVSYLQHRDALWREHVAAALATVPEPGIERVLTIFTASITWSDDHNPKGCSAINARAEIGEGNSDHPVFPEVSRQKIWLLDLFIELCREAGMVDPDGTGRALMLLYEGAIVTVGMQTFSDPFEVAICVARRMLTV